MHCFYMDILKFLDDYVDDDDDEEMNGKETNDKRSKKPKVEKSPRKVSVEVMEKFKSKVKDLLCRAVDHFDPNTVTDSRSEEFMANRLPPFDKHDEDGMSCINLTAVKKEQQES